MKIYDCFLFNNENLLLELRLKELDKYVDYFVIVECKFNHQGNIKGQNIDQNILKKYEKKIKYFYIEDEIISKNAWIIESSQRNFIKRGLLNAKKEDLIIISDLDEIPNLSNINFNEINKNILVFKQIHSVYKFNLIRSYNWYGSKICRYQILKSPQWLRQIKVHKRYPFYRLDKYFSKTYYNNFQVIENGGWHFGWIMNLEDIILKINSYAHTEYNIKKNNNKEFIEKCINDKIDFIDNKELKKIKINLLPTTLQNNINAYERYLFNG